VQKKLFQRAVICHRSAIISLSFLAYLLREGPCRLLAGHPGPTDIRPTLLYPALRFLSGSTIFCPFPYGFCPRGRSGFSQKDPTGSRKLMFLILWPHLPTGSCPSIAPDSRSRYRLLMFALPPALKSLR